MANENPGLPPDPPTDATQAQTLGWQAPPVTTRATLGQGEQFGDYVILSELGRGGMGVVYKAFEPGLSRTVALKMILPGALSSEADLQRFQTEASAAARLSHPHIVRVHRVGVHDGRHFYSMDYVDGVSLAQRLTQGPLPGRVAARYVATIARAIHQAHEQGILHRDLKPGNILLDQADRPYVADFGLAKQFQADHGQTRTGAVLGTPGSMAPEQAMGDKNLTPACDVYGLGALLYELLTTRPPFLGETAFDTLVQVMEHDPPPPRLLNPKVDRDLETICLKCLHKAPGDRYASAEELACDLERYLAGDSIQARSLNLVDQLARTLERSQYDVEFRPYGTMLFWFAAIVGFVHLLKHLLIVWGWPVALVIGTQVVQFACLLLVMWWFRTSGGAHAHPGRRGLLPATTAERQLWSVWISYTLACFLLSFIYTQMHGLDRAYRGELYPYFCLITGVAYSVLGSSYWGWCYALAVAFFTLGVVMVADTSVGSLAFGGMWVVALVAIGMRLRRLGNEREAAS